MFFRIWVENHFPLKGPSIYLCQVSSRAEVLLSWITENKDVSSANSLAFEDNPSDKLLRYIKSVNGPNMEPWGTPAITSDQSETSDLTKLFVFYFSESHIKDLVNCQI